MLIFGNRNKISKSHPHTHTRRTVVVSALAAAVKMGQNH